MCVFQFEAAETEAFAGRGELTEIFAKLRMPLVDYGSSSEDESVAEQTPVTAVEKAAPARAVEGASAKDSIASFLPPPKNRQPATTARARVLGAGIKNTINSHVAHNPDNIVLSKPMGTVTSLVPTSLRNRMKHNRPGAAQAARPAPNQPAEVAKKLTVFEQVRTGKRVALDDQPTIQVGPITQPDEDDIIMGDDQQISQEQEVSKKRTLDYGDQIKNFDVNDFYEQNNELRAQGLLQENKRLHTVTNSKNQLSALVKNAKLDQELLEEKFERNKKLKKERGDRYGW